MPAADPSDPARQKLIAEIYEVALKPELYGDLVDLWETQISAAVARLGELADSAQDHAVLDDPELEDHFRRAYQILERMGRKPRDPVTSHAYVKEQTGACLLFDMQGNCVAGNQLAEVFFGQVLHLKSLAVQFSKENMRMFERMCMRCNRPQANTEACLARTLENGTRAEKTFVGKPVKLDPDHDALMCIRELAIKWSDRLEELLTENFNLTAKETEILRHLCMGLSLQQIADDTGKSMHTIRTQSKTLLQKTGTSSQSDLVRTAMALSMHMGETKGDTPISRYKLTTGERLTVPLDGGRTIPVNCFGPEDGKPVLFIHGMLDGFIFSSEINRQINRLGLRILAPTRAGFGECTLDYDIRSAPVEFAEDVAHILDHFEVEACPVIGHMAGSLYAFAIAGHLKPRITSVVSISGGVPIVGLKQFADMSPRQRVVAWTARFTPRLLPTILRAGIAQIDSGDRESFMNALYKQGTVDRELVRKEAVSIAVQEGYSFAVAQGHRAFEVDSRHVTRNWSEYVDAVIQPVTLVHGTHDPVVSIQSVRNFAKRYKNIELTEFDDCGQLVLFQKPVQVFNQIAASHDFRANIHPLGSATQ